MSSPPSLIFHCTKEDMPFLPILKPLLAGRCQTYVDNTNPTGAFEFVIKSKKKNGCPIVSTSQSLLRMVLPNDTNPSIWEYAGSFVEFHGTKFLFLDPVDSLVKSNTGKFVYKRFLDKILHPEGWIEEPGFKWELFSHGRKEVLLEFFKSCTLIAIDIETPRNDPDKTIACVGYSGIRIFGGQKIEMMTVIVPLDDYGNLSFVRQVNSCSTPKVFQNGKYDNAYFFRYSAPVTNYSFDTINLFHSWLSELPKDLGFISAFMVRNYRYHKNDGKHGDKLEYYQYNALDCYYTVLTCMALLLELPPYAIQNYLLEFPLVFPCHLAEMTGMKHDNKQADILGERVKDKYEAKKKSIQTMVSGKDFNPNSPQQTVRLFEVLGSKDIKGSSKVEVDKVASRHPLNRRILSIITNARKDLKRSSSYFKEGVNWKGRCFYALNPHATDTGRLASTESFFWCGLQIQNIPRDEDGEEAVNVKEVFIADDGFLIGEADRSQAETRDVAYLSGDTALIAAVDDVSKDFHSKNASAFFGLEYEKICRSTFDSIDEIWEHKRLDKPLIDIAKRTNHGANYNMMAQMLLDTMGIERVIRAKKLLGLPSSWALLDVTTYLLKIFDQTYPLLRDKENGYFGFLIRLVETTGLLTGPTGWTRKCFGNPRKNKMDLNAIAAHPSQSLNAMELNVAWNRVFREVWMKWPKDFKLYAQVHDSILFGYRKGREDLAVKVRECMINPLKVKDIFGIERTLIIPVDLKLGGERWSEVKAVSPNFGREKKVAA